MSFTDAKVSHLLYDAIVSNVRKIIASFMRDSRLYLHLVDCAPLLSRKPNSFRCRVVCNAVQHIHVVQSPEFRVLLHLSLDETIGKDPTFYLAANGINPSYTVCHPDVCPHLPLYMLQLVETIDSIGFRKC